MVFDPENSAPLTIPIDAAGRVRLSIAALRHLGWDQQPGDYRCWGAWRGPEELLCAPDWLETEDNGQHPLAALIGEAERLRSLETTDFRAVPPLETLVIPHRLIHFQAKRISDKQLDLRLGRESYLRLAHQTNPRNTHKTKVYAILVGGMLVLTSENQWNEMQKPSLEDLI